MSAYRNGPINAQAICLLQHKYAQMMPHCNRHPWSQKDAIELGILYIKSWEKLPTTNRMDRAYCLPDACTILRLFGSYAAYYALIEKGQFDEEV
jgi:hypothetical protein